VFNKIERCKVIYLFKNSISTQWGENRRKKKKKKEKRTTNLVTKQQQ
jgi:hypothetical protein